MSRSRATDTPNPVSPWTLSHAATDVRSFLIFR